MNITASNIIRLINQLPRNIRYNYVNPKNRNTIEIVNIVFPEGPISIKRSNSSEIQTISKNMIWRLANSVEEGIPVNMERVFGASYNTRSVLEALLAHTPEFYWCRPGRIELTNSTQEIKEGHKHLIWLPNQRHENATLQEYHTDIVISEIPSSLVVYDALKISSHPEIKDINITRHRQIGELSGGQKKRVFLARALAQQAKVILLDEPFTGVDVKTEDAIIELLKALRDEGCVILVSTHTL